MGPVQQALNDAGLKASDIEQGSSGRRLHPYSPLCRNAVARLPPAKSPSRASTPTSASPSAPPSRAAFWAARSRACCCWMSPLCPWALRPWAASSPRSSSATPPSPPRRARFSPPRPTARPRLKSTCFRASVRCAKDNKTPGPLPAGRHPRCAPWRAPDRSHLRHRRQRHRQRLRQGPGHRQGAADHHHLLHQHVQGRHR